MLCFIELRLYLYYLCYWGSSHRKSITYYVKQSWECLWVNSIANYCYIKIGRYILNIWDFIHFLLPHRWKESPNLWKQSLLNHFSVCTINPFFHLFHVSNANDTHSTSVLPASVGLFIVSLGPIQWLSCVHLHSVVNSIFHYKNLKKGKRITRKIRITDTQLHTRGENT